MSVRENVVANLSRPNQLPIVNVVALAAIVLSLIPVYLAQRLTTDPVQAAAPGGGGDKVAAAPVP